MIRSDSLKLIKRYPGPNGHFPDELYDLASDPRERRNLIDEHSYCSSVEQLMAELVAFLNQFCETDGNGSVVARIRAHNGVEPWALTEDELDPIENRIMK